MFSVEFNHNSVKQLFPRVLCGKFLKLFGAGVVPNIKANFLKCFIKADGTDWNWAGLFLLRFKKQNKKTPLLVCGVRGDLLS